MYTIEELSKALNLEPAFIRKLKADLWSILKTEIKKGSKNKDLFSTNAFVIFEQAGKYKADGYSLSEIKKQLEKQLKNTDKTEGKQRITENNNNILLSRFFELQDRYIKDQEEKNERILELSEVVSTLKNELKLLPEGKTPEQIKKEWENQQLKKFEREKLIDELYLVGIFNFWKKKIYEKIKKLDE